VKEQTNNKGSGSNKSIHYVYVCKKLDDANMIAK